jgi:hypothetical protein
VKWRGVKTPAIRHDDERPLCAWKRNYIEQRYRVIPCVRTQGVQISEDLEFLSIDTLQNDLLAVLDAQGVESIGTVAGKKIVAFVPDRIAFGAPGGYPLGMIPRSQLVAAGQKKVVRLRPELFTASQ